jgi:hypothetical protein
MPRAHQATGVQTQIVNFRSSALQTKARIGTFIGNLWDPARATGQAKTKHGPAE